MRPFAKWSIEWKLPLGGAVLLLLVVAVLATAAYREVRRASRAVAAERLLSVANQFSQLLGSSSRALATQVATAAAKPALRQYLNDRSEKSLPEAADALVYRGNQPEQIAAIELWDTAGHRLAAIGPSANRIDTAATRRLLARLASRDSARIGPFQQLGDSIVYPGVAPIVDSAPIGYLVQWRRLTSSPQSRAQTMQLIGPEATLHIGNADGGLWTDLLTRVDGPPADPTATDTADVSEYQRPGLGARLGATRPIAGAPWKVLVEFSGSLVSTPARLFMRRVAAIATILLAVALAALWVASRRISRPLRELTLAAEAVSGADFSKRVGLQRDDELGRLATSFNTMVDRINQAHDQLEDKVTERTRELNQTLSQLREGEHRLQEAKKAAERANRTKSEFLAKMSHELRTPLNSIIGFSEVLQEQRFGQLNERQTRYVGNVLTSGRQLLDLINDILDLSKVEAGRTELVIEPVSLGKALAEVRSLVKVLADSKRITIDLAVEEGLPSVAADESKLKQIMANLLSNAIKFTPDGGRVSIVAREVPSNRDDTATVAEIAVSDTGIGIRTEDQARIFEEFEQIDSPYGRAQQGTGLGLALTKRLVALHQGRIWVESEVEAGSTFFFTLPISGKAPTRPGPTEPRPAIAANPPGGSGGALVPVVEDDDKARELLVHYLVGAGFRVVEARDGDQALAAAEKLMPEAITLDIMLPGLHGHEVLARLKSDPKTREIPVVVVSMTEERELGLSLGAADWLVKPVGREDFLDSIRRAAARAGSTLPLVLVIDDEAATIEFLTDLLTHQGFRVIAAGDGLEGIARAREADPDVIVVDLIMPNVSGFEVVEAIRASPEGREVPIVVFTVKDLTREERTRLERSVQAIVAKGHGREALLRELQLLARRSAAVA